MTETITSATPDADVVWAVVDERDKTIAELTEQRDALARRVAELGALNVHLTLNNGRLRSRLIEAGVTTAPAPTVCATCGGDGIMPFLLDETLAEYAPAILPQLSPRPCVACRCFCGKPATTPGGPCQGHEDQADIDDDTRLRRAAG